MGVGRRMKKQADPPDLSKPRQTLQKGQKFEDSARGKKRKASGEIKAHTPARKGANVTANSESKHAPKVNLANGKTTQAEKGRKWASRPAPAPCDVWWAWG